MGLPEYEYKFLIYAVVYLTDRFHMLYFCSVID